MDQSNQVYDGQKKKFILPIKKSYRPRLLIKLLLALLICLIIFSARYPSPALAATIGGGSTVGSLEIQVTDAGQMGVMRLNSSSVWESQVFSASPGSKGSKLYINGTTVGLGYYDGTSPAFISNSTSGNTITTSWNANSTRITQQTTYVAGNAYYRLEWTIYNDSSSWLSDLRFFHGQDTYLSGTDAGAGFWDASNNAIGVKKSVGGIEQRMTLQGITTPYAYESRLYRDVTSSVSSNALSNAIDTNEATDNGYALEWRAASLAPYSAWTIVAYEKFNNAAVTGLSVSAPVSIECFAGSSCSMSFSVTNVGASTSTVSLSTSTSGGSSYVSWPSSPVSIGAGSTQGVTVQVTPSGGAGTNTNVTLTASDGTNSSSDTGGVSVTTPPYVAPTYVSGSPPSGAYGYSYSYSGFSADGSPVPTFSASGLPTGLSMNNAGVISGTPTQSGTFSVAVTASNPGGSRTWNGSIVISKADTAIAISTHSPSTTGYYQIYTVGATVTSMASFTPSGTVTVSEGTNSCVITLSGATGSCSMASIGIGSGKTLTALYGGTATGFNPSSQTTTHTVIQATSTTSTAFTSSSGATVVYGQPFDLSASTISQYGGFITGSLQFQINGSNYGSAFNSYTGSLVSLANNHFINASAVPYSYTALYSGNSNNVASSAGGTFTVNKVATITSLGSSDTATVYGEPVTFTAAVFAAAPSINIPAGSVEFYADGVLLDTEPLNASGIATLTTHTLTGKGAYAITAVYLGDSNMTSSTSSTLTQTITPAPTSVVVTPDANPVVYGTSILLTVTVNSGGGSIFYPAGTVQLSIDGVKFGSAVTLNASGVATRTVPYLNLWPGHHAIRGVFTPADSLHFQSSNNNGTPLDQVVNKAPPVITIAPSSASPVAYEAVDYTVTVGPSMVTQGTPTGTVQFMVDGGAVGSPLTLDEHGQATLNIQLTVGPHSVTVVYSGDDYFLSVPVSGSLSITAAKNEVTLAIAMVGQPTAVVGEPVTVIIQLLKVAPAISAPTGTVTISNGTDSCTVTSFDGTGYGACLLAATSPGSADLTAHYGGSSQFNGKDSSAVLGPVVSKASSTVGVSGAYVPASPVTGQPVTVYFSVAALAPGAGSPTGNVTVNDGLGHSCTAAVAIGSCQITLTSAGPSTLGLGYAGDTNFNFSSASSITGPVVQKAATSVSLGSSSTPSVYGQLVTFTASVSVSVPGAGSPTGSIQFSIDGVNTGAPVALSSGSANLSTSALSAATHSIAAAYLGDTNFQTSSALTLSQVVNKADTTIVLTSSQNPSPYGQPVLTTATVTANAPSSATPISGTVQFIVDGVPYGAAVPMDGSGHASKLLPYTALWVGTHQITAVYSGSTSFNSCTTSPGLSQLVEYGQIVVTLDTSVDNPVFGQVFKLHTLVEGVGSNYPKPSGTVAFQIDGTAHGGLVTLDANGEADSINVTGLAVGTHSAKVIYSGDDNYIAYTLDVPSGILIAKAETAVSITNTPFSSVVVGQPYTVNFSVTPVAPGAGFPTGTVTVSDGGSSCSALVSVGSCLMTPHSFGASSLSISYAGDSSFNVSSSSGISGPNVSKADVDLTFTSALPASLVVGGTYTVTVHVGPGASSTLIPEGGTLSITNGVKSCSATILANGNASCDIQPISVTAQLLDISYPGDANFNPTSLNDQSGPTVNKADVLLTYVGSLPSSVVVGEAYSVAVHMSPGVGGTLLPPTALVTISNGIQSCSPTVDANGDASCTLTPTVAGATFFSFEYSGSSDFNAKSITTISGPLVSPADVALSLVNTLPTAVVVGEPYDVSVHMTAVNPGTLVPAGALITVTNGTDHCSAAIDASGTMTCAILPTVAGDTTLTFHYLGNSHFNMASLGLVSGPKVNLADVTLTLTSALPDPAVVGQDYTVAVMMTAVPNGTLIPAGAAVQISNGSDTCSAGISVGGSGACVLTSFSVGLSTLSLSYSGSAQFNPASSLDLVGPQINKASTSLAITSTSNPSVYGESVTFNAALSVSAPGTGSPTGKIQFTLDGSDYGAPVNLTAGSASITAADLLTGSYEFSARYLGDSNYLTSSAAPPVTQVVNKARSVVVLQTSKTPSKYGLSVVITATVTAVAPGAITPAEGTVQIIMDGVAYGGPVSLSADGTASKQFTGAPVWVGAHTITAVYSGTANYMAGNTASGLAQVIEKGDVALGITRSVAIPVFGQSFNLAAVLSGAGSNDPEPSGTIQFIVDSVNFGTPVVLSAAGSGVSNLLSALSIGEHTLSVWYSGDDFYAEVTLNAPDGIRIAKADVTPAITNPGFSGVMLGKPYAVTYSVNASAPGAGTPTGTVTISNGVNTCSASVSAGTCNLMPGNLGASALSITYTGDGNFNSAGLGSIDGPVVAKADVAISFSSLIPDSVVLGEEYAITAHAAPPSGGTLTPFGATIRVWSGSDFCDAVVDVLGDATCTLKHTSTGSRLLNLTYAGGPDFNAASISGWTGPQVEAASVLLSYLGSSAANVVVGEPYLVSVHFAPVAPGTLVPFGAEVEITDGTDSCIATVGLNGNASCALVPRAVGATVLAITFVGNTSFQEAGLAGQTGPQVGKAAVALSLAASLPSSVVVGELFSVPVYMSPVNPGTLIPVGAVLSISSGANSCNTVVGAGGDASCPIRGSMVGSSSLTVSFAGDANFNQGQLNIANGPSVGKASVSIGLVSALPGTVMVGQSYEVKTHMSAVPNGTQIPAAGAQVQISNGSRSCTAAIDSSGDAACSIYATAAGTSTLSFSYAGNIQFNTSSLSGITGPNITKANLSLTVGAVSPSNPKVGQPYSVAVAVAPAVNGTMIPSGSTIVISNGTNSCSAVIGVGGSTACSITPTAAGSPSLLASFGGNSQFNSAVSASVSGPTVAPAVTMTSLVSSINPVAENDAVRFTAVVTVSAPGSGQATGFVQFRDSLTDLGAPVALVNGIAVSPEITNLTRGDHTINAEYLGSANFNSSNSAGLLQAVVSGDVSLPVDPANGGTINYYGEHNGQPVQTEVQIPSDSVPNETVVVFRQFAGSNLPKLSQAAMRLGSAQSGLDIVLNFTLEVYINGVFQPKFVFTKPISVSMTYNPYGWKESTFLPYGWTGTAWSANGLPVTWHDLTAHQITFSLTEVGSGQFALVGQHFFQMYMSMLVNPLTDFSFIDNICSATWRNAQNTIGCPQSDGSAEGYVFKSTNPHLENGQYDNEPGLIMGPQYLNDGVLSGKYPATMVQAGDTFRSVLGCEYGAIGCNVNFKLEYVLEGSSSIQTLASWNEYYNNSYTSVAFDLSSLAGKSVRFILTIEANGSPYNDRALWLLPRIVRAK